MEKTRAFICIDMSDEITKEIARIQNILEKQQFRGKLTELPNLHLTLKFLGHITQEKLEETKSALSKISFPALNLTLSQTGTFNLRGKPKIVWIKLTGNVFALHKEVDSVLSEIFPKEERFMSHLTIARIKYSKNPEKLIDYIKQIKPKKLSFEITEFKLKSSSLSPQGPIYNTLETYSLKE